MNVPLPEPGAAIDPRLLKIRVNRIARAKTAHEIAKHRLATYVSEHAPEQCGHDLSRGACAAAVDGFLLFSCGHHAFLCALHGSKALRTLSCADVECRTDEPALHDGPAAGVTVEWIGLT